MVHDQDSFDNGINFFMEKTYGWPTLKMGLPIISLFRYIPFSRGELNSFKKDDFTDIVQREILLNFKTEPPQWVKATRKSARNIAVDFIAYVLDKYFKHTNSTLTFLCAPASTQERYIDRYRDFSKLVSEKTHMTDGFDCLKITNDSEPIHEGGEDPCEYEIDSEWAKNRLFVLFDDIITTGKTMNTLSIRIKKAGGWPVFGITLAHTPDPSTMTNVAKENIVKT